MGAGLAQIGILVVLTVIGLPLFFFGLMAALDRFEKSLSASPRTVLPAPLASPATSVVSAVQVATAAASEAPGAEVLTLPTMPAVAPTTASNTAAAI